MQRISLDKLNVLKKHFESVDSKKHFVTILTINNFIKQFEEFPELKAFATLYGCSNTWDTDGIFFLIVNLNFLKGG